MRSSVFDRNEVNTNINLTSNEQTKYYETVNNDLNRNLYVDLREPRRRKNIDLDVSCVKADRDYDQYLECRFAWTKKKKKYWPRCKLCKSR